MEANSVFLKKLNLMNEFWPRKTSHRLQVCLPEIFASNFKLTTKLFSYLLEIPFRL